jgi:hypothetical protein
MGEAAKSASVPISRRVSLRVEAELDDFVQATEDAATRIAVLREVVAPDVLDKLDAVLSMKQGLSYRDGLIIQLGWGLEVPQFDHTHKGGGGRTAAQAIATALGKRHIAATRDAYQNIGKNTPNLARGNVAAFDDLLRWMNTAEEAERQSLLSLLLATVAMTARNVLPMPQLARAELTFAKVALLLTDLFAIPSGGVYEQFAVAAFLDALIDEFGLGGVGRLGVKTKNINASDASSGTAADVQIMRGNKIEEAFEISASGWKGKVSQALDAARNADLPRVHILAYGDDLDGLGDLLTDSTTDISVMDVRGFVRLVVGLLKKPAREGALRRLYELIERNQPEADRVNTYVGLLRSHVLTA